MHIHKIIFTEVQKTVNKHDIIGLIGGGAPEDEYHTEIGKLVALLRLELSIDCLAREIELIFKVSFGEIESNKQVYVTLAQELLDLKKRLRW